jgi:regulator of RNase E activity RraA
MMENHDLSKQFLELSTALIADACVRHNCAIRIAPPGIRPLLPGTLLAGRVLPARHYGSVDVFLEAMSGAKPGDVLVVDNGGRPDEGCVGDLIALEAEASGLAGMALWGFHRDTTELLRIGLPLFSYGVCPAGPLRVDQREPDALSRARFGDFFVTGQDAIFADDDGLIFVSLQNVAEILATALKLRDIERQQAELLHGGKTLRQQLNFDEYLRKRAADPSYTFREHLRQIGGAIEE